LAGISEVLIHYYRPFTVEDHAEAKKHFDQAVVLDPNFGGAHAMLALAAVDAFRSGLSSYTTTYEKVIVEAVRS
jgi:adenylate cyclase